ncbi:LysR family transcriptional regulator [Novosphingobium sp. 1949]|uniref:LysR family transcriptional regulator n=1 Tax=Novosphingobium organovorum TaxID=2930092 RepID=A0ABT0B876_9SPHN|nr:LysR family transcriptional regulator [Novosphingobium organovorum]MCJ2181266.1 LysR family transcriptional regulator [Novosphingobium organovorum]
MHRIDRIDYFRIVDAIHRTGNLSSAARELGLSLTAISKRLTSLEETLGVRLIQRTTRTLHFTEEGAIFLEHCRNVLDAVAAAQEIGPGHTRSGTVRVTAAVAFSQRQIAPRLAAFLQEHPNIAVQILPNNRPIDLVEQQIDVAFRQAPLDNSAYITRTIAPDDEFLCAAPAYLARHGTPLTPDDLQHHQFLSVGDPAPHALVLTSGRHEVNARVHSTVGSTDGEIPHLAALDGCGIALKSSWDVIDDLRAGRLVRVLPDWWGRARTLRVVYPVRGYQPTRVGAFIEFMERELRAAAHRNRDLNLFRVRD